MLLIARAKPGEEGLALVRFAIAIGILGIKNFGRRADDHALPPRDDAIGKVEAIKKHSRFVVMPRVVGVFEETHDSAWLAFAIQSERVIDHLDDPKLAIRAPLESD